MKLTAAVISLGSVSSKWTAEAMRKYFEKVDEINLKDIEVNLSSKDERILHLGKPMQNYDCVYVKGSFRYSQLMRGIVTEVSSHSYVPVQPGTFTLVHDKVLTQLILEREEIPMPKTYMAATNDAAKKILEKISFPIIMKFPSGTQGKGVMFAESYAAASSMLDALEALKQPFIIQEYIDTDNMDVRVLVAGDKVIGTMRRRGKLDEKRANIHAGAVGESYEPSALTKKIALKTAKALGAEIAGIDVLESAKGPYVIEANISPGLQGITKATGEDIADKVAMFLHKKTLEWKETHAQKEAGKILKDISKKDPDEYSQVITKLSVRGERILLPDLATKVSKFRDEEEVVLELAKNHIKIKKL